MGRESARRPDLSFIIPCYNLGNYLGEAIDSALAQTAGTIEVIVVDDGSSDDTSAVAAGYGDRIRYIHKKNAGLSAARNTGILIAQGRWLHFLDADDTVEPSLLPRVLEEEALRPEIDVYVCGYRGIDGESDFLWESRAPALEDDLFHQMLAQGLAPPVVFVVRRECFANAGIFNVKLRACEDLEMWLRLAASGCRFGRIDATLASYRQLPNSMSRNAENMWRSAKATVRLARAFAGHGRCSRCRRQAANSKLGIANLYVAGYVYGPHEGRQPGEWKRRLQRLAPLLWRNPSMVGPWFASRGIRLWKRLVR